MSTILPEGLPDFVDVPTMRPAVIHSLTEIKRGEAVTGFKCSCGRFNPAGDLTSQQYQVLAHTHRPLISYDSEGTYYEEKP